MTHYVTKVAIRRDAPIAALRHVLAPDSASARASVGHRLLWTLFADKADRERDFLWRETDSGTFHVLSARTPTDHHALFEIDQPQPFDPTFQVGDRVSFMLRANATVARSAGPGQRGKRSDVVMDALYQVPKGSRAERRREVVGTAGIDWLERQGERCGFAVPRDDAGTRMASGIAYDVWRVEHAGPAARLGVVDLAGTLEVRDGDRFLKSIHEGFGRAKSFGCGLMLVRPE